MTNGNQLSYVFFISLAVLLISVPVLHALQIESKVENEPWSSYSAVWPLSGQKIKLRIRDDAPGDVRWYRIIPKTAKLYHNAEWPWNPGAYKWLGYEKIEYAVCEVQSWAGSREVSLTPLPQLIPGCPLEDHISAHNRDNVGSF